MIRHETSESSRQDWFVRAAAVIGDFTSPFYGEERQRDVWNEASAFGLQLLLWLTMLATSIAIWVIGRPAVGYALSLFALVGVTALATMVYAARLGIDVAVPPRLRPLRLMPYCLLLVVFYVGVFRALLSSGAGFDPGSFEFSFTLGTAIGAGSALALTVRSVLRSGRDNE